MTYTRPIGPFKHPRPKVLHEGHRRRIDGYIRGGLSEGDIARLTGVERWYVRCRRRRLRSLARQARAA